MARSNALQVYRVNTGSCGGCDLVIEETVAASAELCWADDPMAADALLVTGPVTPVARPAFLALARSLEGRVPLLAVGRCAIDGHPYGRGGLVELRDFAIDETLEGCPITAEELIEAVRRVIARRAQPAARS